MTLIVLSNFYNPVNRKTDIAIILHFVLIWLIFLSKIIFRCFCKKDKVCLIDIKTPQEDQLEIFRSLVGVFECGKSKFDICFWIRPFLLHASALFVQKRPKLGENGKSYHKKCSLLPPMKGLSNRSIHGSEKQFAVQKSVKGKCIVTEDNSQTWKTVYP